MIRTKLKHKVGLVVLGIFLTLIILEIGLSTTGFILYSLQREGGGITEYKNEYKILTLGESTTANLFNGQSSWPKELERILNNRSPVTNFKVFNEGLPGATSDYILGKLEENLLKYTPDMVIAMMGINDCQIYNKFEMGEKTDEIFCVGGVDINKLNGTLEEKGINKNKRTPFFMRLKVIKLFNLIYAHLEDKVYRGKEEDVFNKSPYCLFPDCRDKELNKDINLSYYELGWIYYNHGRFWDSIEMFKKAIELNQDNDWAHDGLGRIYHHQNRLNLSEEMYKKSIELNPDNDQPYYGLGWIYYNQSRFKDAEEMFKKAIKLNPDDSLSYDGLGRIYHHQNRLNLSEEMYKKAIEINGQSHYGLVWLYYDQGKFKDAEKMFKKAIELNRNTDQSYYGLGWLNYIHDRMGDAEEMFKKAIELNPKNAWAYDWLGWIYRTQSRFEEALEMYEKAIELNPDNNQVHYWLGWIYNLQGRFKDAEEMYEKAKLYDEREVHTPWFLNPVIEDNYQEMHKITKDKGIKLVVMQYPTLSIDILKRIFEGNEGIIFIDNEDSFKEAIENGRYYDYFTDIFAGTFGHCTLKGNRMIADNVANVLLNDLEID